MELGILSLFVIYGLVALPYSLLLKKKHDHFIFSVAMSIGITAETIYILSLFKLGTFEFTCFTLAALAAIGYFMLVLKNISRVKETKITVNSLLSRMLGTLAKWRKLSILEKSVLATTCIVLFLAFYHAVLFPATTADALGLHLPGAAYIASKHEIPIDWNKVFLNDIWNKFYYNLGLFDCAASWFYMNNIPALARSIPPICAVIAVLCIRRIYGKLYGNKGWLYAVLPLLASPVFIASAMVFYNDMFITMFVLVSVYYLIMYLKGEGGIDFLVVSWIAAGFAAMVKYTAVMALLLNLMICLIFYAKEKNARGLRATLGLPIGIIVGCFHYAKNFLVYFSPFYPFYNFVSWDIFDKAASLFFKVNVNGPPSNLQEYILFQDMAYAILFIFILLLEVIIYFLIRPQKILKLLSPIVEKGHLLRIIYASIILTVFSAGILCLSFLGPINMMNMLLVFGETVTIRLGLASSEASMGPLLVSLGIVGLVWSLKGHNSLSKSISISVVTLVALFVLFKGVDLHFTIDIFYQYGRYLLPLFALLSVIAGRILYKTVRAVHGRKFLRLTLIGVIAVNILATLGMAGLGFKGYVNPLGYALLNPFASDHEKLEHWRPFVIHAIDYINENVDENAIILFFGGEYYYINNWERLIPADQSDIVEDMRQAQDVAAVEEVIKKYKIGYILIEYDHFYDYFYNLTGQPTGYKILRELFLDDTRLTLFFFEQDTRAYSLYKGQYSAVYSCHKILYGS